MTKNKQTIKRFAIFHNLSSGGSVRMLRELTRHLTKIGTVDIFSISEQSTSQKLRSKKVRTINKKVTPWKGFICRNLWIATILPVIHRNLANNIDKKKYDLVIINHDYFTKSPLIMRYLRTKMVYILHEPPREFYESSKYHAPYLKDKIANIMRYYIKILDENNVKHSHNILVNSKYSQKVVEKVYRKNSVVLPLGVNTKRFVPGNSKKKQLLLVGSLSRVKGHDFVIRSIKKIICRYRVVIVGDGRKKDKDYLESIIGANRECVTFLEKVTEKKLISLYQESLVTCTGSHFEPFGLTSLESQACGTPVVAIAEGGYEESIVNGVSGYLSKRNEAEFAAKVIRAIRNKGNLSKTARDNAINWSWMKTWKIFDQYIEKC